MTQTLVPTLTTNHVSSVPMLLREKRSNLQIFSALIFTYRSLLDEPDTQWVAIVETIVGLDCCNQQKD